MHRRHGENHRRLQKVAVDASSPMSSDDASEVDMIVLFAEMASRSRLGARMPIGQAVIASMRAVHELVDVATRNELKYSADI